MFRSYSFSHLDSVKGITLEWLLILQNVKALYVVQNILTIKRERKMDQFSDLTVMCLIAEWSVIQMVI